MRISIVTLLALPYFFYAFKDAVFHLRGRRVTATEHALHAIIGVTLLVMFAQAFAGNDLKMLVMVLLFLVGGAADEFIWHREIPQAETDLHSKSHLTLLVFVVGTLAVNALAAHGWQVRWVWDLMRS